MKRCFRRICFSAALVAFGSGVPARAAVGLILTNMGASTTSINIAPNGTFTTSVKLTTQTAQDGVSGVDYQIKASTNGLPASGVIEFLSRNTQTSGSVFTSPNGSADSALSAFVLNPTNGTDLGSSEAVVTNSVSGSATSEVADVQFKVVPGTPAGVYTLSFVSTSYAGPSPAFTAGSFATLGTFTVTVPEPKQGILLLTGLTALCLRRSRATPFFTGAGNE